MALDARSLLHLLTSAMSAPASATASPARLTNMVRLLRPVRMIATAWLMCACGELVPIALLVCLRALGDALQMAGVDRNQNKRVGREVFMLDYKVRPGTSRSAQKRTAEACCSCSAAHDVPWQELCMLQYHLDAHGQPEARLMRAWLRAGGVAC